MQLLGQLLNAQVYGIKNDLDHILTEGDLIYKGMNTTNYLMTEDLPESVSINESELTNCQTC